MANDNVSTYVTRLLCGTQGCLSFKQLHKEVNDKFGISCQALIDILRDGSKFIIAQGKEEKIPGFDLSSDSTIITKTSVRLCESYPNCDNCNNLHLCKYFIYGTCPNGNGGDKCASSHESHSAHNLAILRKNQLQDLEEVKLFQLLLQNDSSLLPEICPYYNKGDGEHGSCEFKIDCANLHVCQYFYRGDCKFGSVCKRSHESDPRKILAWRFSAEIASILPGIYKNKYMIDNSERTNKA
ncbi:protein mono-ADP-ribosyltransferase PARP12 [Amia ocellicauda]|uniref:protein mono-ADP-ribosyltransferase PARP12 n=1 Tax=Amia ocellicauda TaxID=2972642 RepID=UPI00346466CE